MIDSIKKFRVWHEMCHNFGYFKLEDGSHLHVHGAPEQFTGLLDRNGKEIYEGDIVRYRSDILLGRAICVVTFYNCRWTLFQYDAPVWAISEGDSENIEVIGNIHEPPKDFRPEHLKRMGVSINKGGVE